MGQSPFAQRMSAGYDLIYRLGKDYEKPAFEITTVKSAGVVVGVASVLMWRRARASMAIAAL